MCLTEISVIVVDSQADRSRTPITQTRPVAQMKLYQMRRQPDETSHTGRGPPGQVTGTRNGLVPENHWYEEMVGTKIGLAPKYCWYKRTVRAMKLLVPRNYWYY
jgi:hypothetical protein